MTYLELVNAVLTRLREDNVNSVSETDYSKLVGAFVNDAKRVVEDAWPWSHLLRQVSFTLTTGSAGSYDLEDYTTVEAAEQINERARLFVDPQTNCTMVYAVTDNKERELEVIPQTKWKVTRVAEATDGTSGQVEAVITATNPTAVSGKTKLRFYTSPSIADEAETILMYIINPQNALVGNGEVLLVPSDPVVQLAYLYCLYERGEELGEMMTLTVNKSESALADAIMFDSSMTSEVVMTAP
jgi:hypothetical protein